MHPILFRIGSFPIALYGMMIAIGMALAVALGIKLAKREGIKSEVVIDIVFYAVIAGMLGARILFIFVNFSDFLNNPMFYIFNRQGFVLLGGLAGAAPVVHFLIKKHKVPVATGADIGVIGVVLGQAFGRIGCFFSGCCYGKITDSFLGVQFPRCFYPDIVTNSMSSTEIARLMMKGQTVLEGSPAFVQHVEDGLVKLSDTQSLSVFPTQLFHSLSNFIIFSLLLFLFLKKRKFPGQIASLYLILYSITRFSIEILRGDTERGLYFHVISTSQIISILIFAFGFWLYKRYKKIYKNNMLENKD